MRTCIATIQSLSPYSQSQNIDREVHPKKDKESDDAYEQRTWRFRMHSSADGHVEIPPTAFANCIKQAARRLGIAVKGKRGATYAKYFEAGVMCVKPLVLDVTLADVKAERLFLSTTGTPGSGAGNKRVWKLYPRIESWRGDVEFVLLDDLITEEVFLTTLTSAGQLVGIGRHRPENRGVYGRFDVESVRWDSMGIAAE